MSLVIGEAVGHWVCEKAGGHWTPLCQAIGWEVAGELVAGIMYDGYTGPGGSIAMHSRCEDPAKVSRKWLWAIFDYPFNQLAVRRVSGLVPATNTRAQETNEHLGWQRETTLADYFPDGDGIVYIMRKEDCRWLRLGARYAKEVQA